MVIRSRALRAGQSIPPRYTQDGEGLSPPLSWSNVPAETDEFALIMDDPDAPTPEPFVHWLLYKIPARADALPEGIKPSPRPARPSGALQGVNSARRTGYLGPGPPRGHGTHHYRFRLYALDTVLNLRPNADRQALAEAMQGHVLAEAELIGTCAR